MPTETLREVFLIGLRNAHAMENQALSIMRPQLSRIENYPEVATALERHIRETEGQLGRIDEILSGLNEAASTLKDTALSLTGSLAALGHTMAGDEIIKNSFANFAFEHFEIAAYVSLITLADDGGFASARQLLEQNLVEEVAMADTIEQSIPIVTRRFIELKQAGETAKV